MEIINTSEVQEDSSVPHTVYRKNQDSKLYPKEIVDSSKPHENNSEDIIPVHVAAIMDGNRSMYTGVKVMTRDMVNTLKNVEDNIFTTFSLTIISYYLS